MGCFTDIQRETLNSLKEAVMAVHSCKAVLEKDVTDRAVRLTSSLKGLEARLLNFGHVEAELSHTIDVFNKRYFEARYGDYIFVRTIRFREDWSCASFNHVLYGP
jgi:hypothetical protein